MLPLRLLCLLCFLAWVATPANGQSLRFQRFTTQQGLAHNVIRTLTQDAQGFIWIGTDEGLSRFDGLEFRNFYHHRRGSGSLPGNTVTGLAPTRDGMWVGTSLGLARYEPRTQRFTSYPVRQAGVGDREANIFNRVVRRRNGEIWATTSAALWRFDAWGRVKACYPANSQQLAPHFKTIGLSQQRCEDQQGRLWLTTGYNLLVYDPATNEWWDRDHNPRGWRALDLVITDGKPITNVLIDRRGRTWFGTWNNGLYCFDPTTNALRHWSGHERKLTGLPDPIVNCLLEDRNGTLWIGTYNTGLVRFHETSGRFETSLPNAADPNALPHRSITSLFEDRQGNVWVGTEDGLALASPLATRFESWPVPGWISLIAGKAPGPPELGAVLEDRSGHIWVGSYGQGLYQFDPATARFEHYRMPKPFWLAPDAFNEQYLVWELAQDRQGLLWVATQKGLLRFDPERYTWQPAPDVPHDLDFLNKQVVSTLYTDRSDNLWAAVFHYGLVRYDQDRKRWQLFSAAPHPDRPDTVLKAILTIAQDRAGNYWLASGRLRGLARLPADLAHAATYLQADGREGPPDNELTTVLVDPGDTLWIGSFRTGLYRGTPGSGRWQIFDRDEGLGSTNVHCLSRDLQGRLWIGTSGGLAVYEPRSGRLRNFTQADGLPENLVHKMFFSPRSGYLWMIADHHLLRVRPADLPVNKVPPPVVLTGFAVNGHPRPIPDHGEVLKLQPDETTLVFDFAALNLLSPRSNRYSYRLEGAANAGWTAAGTTRSVTYADLPPGDYTFRVRAANNDGLWNSRGVAVRFRLPPPWYRTWWFRGLLAVAAMGLVYGYYHLRLSRVVALQNARNQIARDLHDDVGSTLSSILIQSRMPVSAARADDRLHKIGDSAQRMLDALHDIVWAVNPDHDPLPAVIARMRAFAAQVLEARGVALDFKVEGQPEQVSLRLGRRRDFYLIFKEAITNAAKYAEASSVRVSLQASASRLRLEVCDDGRGFDPDAPARGSGNGLRNLRQRASALGATFSFETAPGQGTCLELAFRPG